MENFEKQKEEVISRYDKEVEIRKKNEDELEKAANVQGLTLQQYKNNLQSTGGTAGAPVGTPTGGGTAGAPQTNVIYTIPAPPFLNQIQTAITRADGGSSR
jgi:hypothetical protein